MHRLKSAVHKNAASVLQKNAFAAAVGFSHGLGHLAGEVDGAVRRDGSVADYAGERAALDEGHGEECVPVDFVGLEDGADVGVLEGGGGLGFAQETLALALVHIALVEKLESDVTFKTEILGAIHHAHTALAKLVEDSIVRNDATDHRGNAFQLYLGRFT